MNQAKDKFILIVVLIVVYGGMQLIGITCPIKYVTGVSCAGCGMTRAWMTLLLHHDLELAMYYHPLFWMVVPALIIYLLRKRMPKRLCMILLWGMASAAIVVYLWRMIAHTGDIVVFEPKNGLAGLLLQSFFQLIGWKIW